MLEVYERHTSAEHAIAAAEELLHSPDVTSRIPDHQKYQELLDRLYVPEVRDGSVVILQDDTSIPLVPVMNGERLRINADSLKPTSQQWSRVSEQMQDRDIAEDRIQYFTRGIQGLRSTDQHVLDMASISSVASVSSVGYSLHLAASGALEQDSHTLQLDGRPVVSMAVRREVGQREITAGSAIGHILLHELVHVVQREERPLIDRQALRREQIQREVEAYANGAEFARAIILGAAAAEADLYGQVECLTFMQRTMAIDRVRVRARAIDHHDDPYAATDELIQLAREAGPGVVATLQIDEL